MKIDGSIPKTININQVPQWLHHLDKTCGVDRSKLKPAARKFECILAGLEG